MEAHYGWPEGTIDRRAGDGASTLAITFTADSLPEDIQQAVEAGRVMDVEEEQPA